VGRSLSAFSFAGAGMSFFSFAGSVFATVLFVEESFTGADFSTLIVATLLSAGDVFATAGFSFGAAGLSAFSFVGSAFAVLTVPVSLLGAFGLSASLLRADSLAGFKSASVTGSARRTTSFGFAGWTGIAFSSRGTKISWPKAGATNASAQNRAVEALRNMRATFVDYPPAAWQAFCSKFYPGLLRLRQGDP